MSLVPFLLSLLLQMDFQGQVSDASHPPTRLTKVQPIVVGVLVIQPPFCCRSSAPEEAVLMDSGLENYLYLDDKKVNILARPDSRVTATSFSSLKRSKEEARNLEPPKRRK